MLKSSKTLRQKQATKPKNIQGLNNELIRNLINEKLSFILLWGNSLTPFFMKYLPNRGKYNCKDYWNDFQPQSLQIFSSIT